MADKDSKDITDSVVGKGLGGQEGVVQVFFRIPVGLSIRVGIESERLRTSKRLLWIAAMEAYLRKASEPTGKAGL